MRDSWLYLACLAHDKANDLLPADILDRVPLGAEGELGPEDYTTELTAAFYAAHPHCRVGVVRYQPPAVFRKGPSRRQA